MLMHMQCFCVASDANAYAFFCFGCCASSKFRMISARFYGFQKNILTRAESQGFMILTVIPSAWGICLSHTTADDSVYFFIWLLTTDIPHTSWAAWLVIYWGQWWKKCTWLLKVQFVIPLMIIITTRQQTHFLEVYLLHPATHHSISFDCRNISLIKKWQNMCMKIWKCAVWNSSLIGVATLWHNLSMRSVHACAVVWHQSDWCVESKLIPVWCRSDCVRVTGELLCSTPRLTERSQPVCPTTDVCWM